MIVGNISQKVATKEPQKEVINIDTDSEDSDSGEEVEVVDANVGWIYLGSHNFTPSAWGTLSGSAFNPIMNVRVNTMYYPQKLDLQQFRADT